MSNNRFVPIFGCEVDANHTGHPYSSLLLDSCFKAFRSELGSLNTSEVQQLGIFAEDFVDEASVLSLPERYRLSQATFLPNLVLRQCLSYLDYLPQDHPDITANLSPEIGVLGYSVGAIAALVVASSKTLIDFLFNACQAYRTAFWIGVRVQLFRQEHCSPVDPQGPWAVNLLGADVKRLLDALNETHHQLPCIIAQQDEYCFTISDDPPRLLDFLKILPSHITYRSTPIGVPYHSPTHGPALKHRVMEDLFSREIHFPISGGPILPARCSTYGELGPGRTLQETLLETILVLPVDWLSLVKQTAALLEGETSISLLNVCESTLLQGFHRFLPPQAIHVMKVPSTPKLAGEHHHPKPVPVAIVGMAVDMPGAADVDQLWNLLAAGLNTVQEIPKERFDHHRYTLERTGGRSLSTRMGNFIDGADEFDHGFFSVSPREAKSMDPQQRLLLHVAQNALDDAGYVPKSTPTSDPARIGCFMGAATLDYVQNLRHQIDAHYSTGTLKSFLSGRLSHFFGFSGPSIVVDTACSSSAVAIHQAVRALTMHDCDMTLAGGVNVITSPDMFMGLEKGRFLSPSGQCKVFDASADGYGRAEGCGVFVLKRLSDAIAENDRIWGIIRGVELNQSGTTRSITRPHVQTQAALLRRVLSVSGVAPHEVNIVEAHGTGTQAGDINEVEGIRSVLATDRPSNNPLYITGIKSNVGHLEAASACASLAKILLMMREKAIPRQISLHVLNPRLSPLPKDGSVIINTDRNLSWVPCVEGKPLSAVISNFGASGSNTAMLIEEHKPSNLGSMAWDARRSYVFGLSAKTPDALSEMRTGYLEWLARLASSGVSIPLGDLAYTTTARRQVHQFRLAISASSSNELVTKLSNASLSERAGGGSHVVVVFTGQGSYYRGMGRSLCETSPVFQRAVEECNSILTSFGCQSVLSAIIDDVGRDSCGPPTVEEVHVATFVLEYALGCLWMKMGLRPTVLLGHSLGEYATLVTANVLTLQDAIRIVATRARLIQEHCSLSTSGMLAVRLSGQIVQALLDADESFSHLSVSCFNSPQDCVVSGQLDQLERLRCHLHAKMNCVGTLLPLSYGFHGPAMNPIRDKFTQVVYSVTYGSPTIPVASTTLGCMVYPGDTTTFTADYLVRHCLEPVRFEEAVSALMASRSCQNGALWLEVGPHPAVVPLLKRFPSLCHAPTTVSLRKGKDAWKSMAEALAMLYEGDFGIDWRTVFGQVGSASVISLPPYPFTKTKFWVPFSEEVSPNLERLSAPMTISSQIAARDVRMTSGGGDSPLSHITPLKPLERQVKGHNVAGFAIFPASLYFQNALSSAISSLRQASLYPRGAHLFLHQIEFIHPLLWDEDAERGSRYVTNVVDIDHHSFRISSGVGATAEVLHVRGRFDVQPLIKSMSKFALTLGQISMRIERILGCPESELQTYSRTGVYEELLLPIVTYNDDFKVVRSLNLSSDGTEAVAFLEPVDGWRTADDDCNTAFMDAMLHVPGLLTNKHRSEGEIVLCTQAGFLSIIHDLIHPSSTYILYATCWRPSDRSELVAESHILSNDGSKTIVASVTGIHFRFLRLSAFKTAIGLPVSARARPSLMDEGTSLDFEPHVELFSEASHDRSRSKPIKDLDRRQYGGTGARPPIADTLAKVLEMDVVALDRHTPFCAFGVDSLTTIEVTHILREQYAVNLTPGAFEVYDTVSRLEEHIANQSNLAGVSGVGVSGLSLPETSVWLKQIQTYDASEASLVLIHAGSGTIAPYQRLPPLQRNVWAIQNPRLYHNSLWESIEEMATVYAEQVAKTVKGPIILGGWSFGGVVAFEVAKRLANQDLAVEAVLLIDAPPPIKHTIMSPLLIGHILDANLQLPAGAKRDFIKQALMNSIKLLDQYSSPPAAGSRLPRVSYVRCTEYLSLAHLPYDIPIPDWMSSDAGGLSTVVEWEKATNQPVAHYVVPATHFNVFSEEIEATAEVIMRVLQMLRGSLYWDIVDRS